MTRKTRAWAIMSDNEIILENGEHWGMAYSIFVTKKEAESALSDGCNDPKAKIIPVLITELPRRGK